eukprot:scaffold1354_cov366-Pavlova_lutheri.AAC.2
MGTLGWEANDVPYNCFRFAEQQSTLIVLTAHQMSMEVLRHTIKNQSTTWPMDDLEESVMPLEKEDDIAINVCVSSSTNGELAAKQETVMRPVKSVKNNSMDMSYPEYRPDCNFSNSSNFLRFPTYKQFRMGSWFLRFSVVYKRMYSNEKIRVLAGCRGLSFPCHMCRRVLRSQLYKLKVASLAHNHGEM